MARSVCKLSILAALTVTISGCASSAGWPFRDSAPQMPLANSAPLPAPNQAQSAKPTKWNKMVDSIKESFAAKPSESNGEQTSASPLESQIAMARLVERRGEAAEAEAIYRSLLNAHGEHPTLLHRLGVLAAQDSRVPEAEQLLAHAARLDSDNHELMNDLAYVYFLQDRLVDSESLLRRVLKIDPRNKRARNNLGLAVGLQGRVDESLYIFRRAADSDAAAYANQAYILAQLGDLDRAESIYARALSIDSDLHSVGEALVEVNRARKVQRLAALANNATPEAAHEVAKLRADLAKSSSVPTAPFQQTESVSRVAGVNSIPVNPNLPANEGLSQARLPQGTFSTSRVANTLPPAPMPISLQPEHAGERPAQPVIPAAAYSTPEGQGRENGVVRAKVESHPEPKRATPAWLRVSDDR